MARKYRTHVREEKAVEINLKVDELSQYKDAWLWFCNNAREYPDFIYKVSNSSGNSIFILVNPDRVKELRAIAEDYGDIVWVEDKVAIFVDVTTDYTDFDTDFIDGEYVFGEID